MITFREKLFNEIERLASDTGLGTVEHDGFILAQDGFITVVQLKYEFSSRSHIMLLINGAKHGPPGIDNYYVKATDYERINEFLRRWQQLCTDYVHARNNKRYDELKGK